MGIYLDEPYPPQILPDYMSRRTGRGMVERGALVLVA